MPRYEKGILGVKKDPKNQILFSFGVREGEEWPSEDSDSDYEPTQAEAEEVGLKISRVKRKKAQKTSKETTKRRRVSGKNAGGSSKHGHSNKKFKTNLAETVRRKSKEGDTWWHSTGGAFQCHLPPEIWLNIFQYVVHTDGALPFLCRAARVCSLWSKVCTHPSLWTNVDLSYGWIKSEDATLTWLSENRFSALQHLNLSSWKTLTHAGIQPLAEHCKQLQSINLSHCAKLTSTSIKLLVDSCPLLASVDLSFTSQDVTSVAALKHLVEKCGTRLLHLSVGGNLLKGFTSVLNCITDHCPNLELLDLSNAQFSSDFLTFNIERMQAGCPRLKVLRLTNSKFRAPYASRQAQLRSTAWRAVVSRKLYLLHIEAALVLDTTDLSYWTIYLQEQSAGFPCLDQLSVAVSTSGVNVGLGMDDQFLNRVLKGSRELSLLDLRGCANISSGGLERLPLAHLERLFVSQSSIAKYAGIEDITQKWKHSLVELDLSWNVFPEESFDLALLRLAIFDQSKLEVLNLSGTSVTAIRVQDLLKGCPRLASLNLCSCRGLPRGMKREYKGDGLDELRRNIRTIISQETD